MSEPEAPIIDADELVIEQDFDGQVYAIGLKNKQVVMTVADLNIVQDLRDVLALLPKKIPFSIKG